jgi:hypothetical protein
MGKYVNAFAPLLSSFLYSARFIFGALSVHSKIDKRILALSAGPWPSIVKLFRFLQKTPKRKSTILCFYQVPLLLFAELAYETLKSIPICNLSLLHSYKILNHLVPQT